MKTSVANAAACAKAANRDRAAISAIASRDVAVTVLDKARMPSPHSTSAPVPARIHIMRLLVWRP